MDKKVKNVKTKDKTEANESALLRSQLARALADYDNLRKRVESEKESWVKLSSERILLKLFPIIDILESAQDHLKDQGLAIAIDEFKKVLKEEGIEEISPKAGEEFNPEVEEAVEVTEGGKKGTIAEVLLNGWKYTDDRLIRVVKVKVYGEESKKETVES